jgi:hypothetical protein
MAHYAEAFYIQPGQCFRFVHNGVGYAQHFPAPVSRHCVFVDAKGKRWEVDACEENAEKPTTDSPPVPASPSIL